MLTLICPKCGQIKKASTFKDKICSDCYLKLSPIADNKIKLKEFVICKACGRTRNKNKWTPFSEDEIGEILSDNLKGNLEDSSIVSTNTEFTKDRIKITADIEGTLNDKKQKNKVSLVITPKYVLCDDCYKNMSDYFAARMQIRYEDNVVENEEYKKIWKDQGIRLYLIEMMNDIVKVLRKDGEFSAHLQKIEDVKNGFDMYIGSKNQALKFRTQVRNLFKTDIKDSFTLVGMTKRGDPKMRYTYLIRII